MSSSSGSTLPHGERRRHVRVRDAVGLQVRKLTELPAAGEPDDHAADAGRHGSKKRLREPNKYDIDGYAQVRRDHPAVAAYITDLEERIRQLLLDGEPSAERPSHKVILSSAGMVFADDDLLQPGELLGITLTLFPGQNRIGTDCEVMSVNEVRERAMGGQHTYRVRFLRMSDPDRRTLETHINRLMDQLPQVTSDD